MRYDMDYIEGKPYQKVTLWENSAPTSTFASQTVTLEDDITNYDQVEFIYAYDTTNQSGTYVDSIIYKVSDFISLPYASNIINKFALVNHITGKYVCRILGYTSNTQISFNSAYWVNASGSDNTRCVPLKIIGIKKGLGEQGFKVKKGFDAGGSVHHIDCGFEPDYLFFMGRSGSNNRMTSSCYNKEYNSSKYMERLGEVGYENSLPTTDAYGLNSVDSTGFTVGANLYNFYWVAVKEV